MLQKMLTSRRKMAREEQQEGNGKSLPPDDRGRCTRTKPCARKARRGRMDRKARVGSPPASGHTRHLHGCTQAESEEADKSIFSKWKRKESRGSYTKREETLSERL